MKQFYCMITLLVISFSSITTANGQSLERRKKDFPINISLMHETKSIPILGNPFRYAFNPSFSIGTEYLLKRKNNHDFHLSGNIGYYYHKYWESTTYAEARIGYEYFIKRFSIGYELGFGYAHIFKAKPTYGYEDGKFQQVTDMGVSAFQSSFSIIPSFRLGRAENSPEVYLTYSFAIQYPFSETHGFHQFVGVGYKFYPFQTK